MSTQQTDPAQSAYAAPGYGAPGDPAYQGTGGTASGQTGGTPEQQAAVSVVITSISENRADGAYWVVGTVGGANYIFRWAKPLDIVVPGGAGLAQVMANEYTAISNVLTSTFLGKTINVVFVGTPTPTTYAVAFSATLASAFQNPGAGQIVLLGTVNASPTAYPVNVTVNEFLQWVNANNPPTVGALSIGQIIATRIVGAYMASTGALAQYIGTFSNVTPQSAQDLETPGAMQKAIAAIKVDLATGPSGQLPSQQQPGPDSTQPPQQQYPGYQYPPQTQYPQGGQPHA